MLKITSRDNEKLKQARKIRNGDGNDLIFVEGLRLAEEAVRSHLQIEEVFFTENFTRNNRAKQFLDNVSNKQIVITEVSEKVFDSLADTKTSQGIVLISQKPSTGKSVVENSLQKKKPNVPLLIVLHQINNPSNLGAILRIAEAVDVAGIVLTKNSADVFSPKALRGAMGASFRLPIWTNADFSEVLDWAKKRNFASVCADVKAEKSYLEIDWKKPRLLVFGSEAHGLSAIESDAIEESIQIPMDNGVESLNLAVSCGVILFEAKRQFVEN
ncbi:MAG: RNA methyltransferase [Acidobacteria bacterium]|nr:RNA methyltransferase [Acidobacteriota bacterium]MCA1639925.1 RNA methyltransferase [Acidobacteriota bacterium]